MFKANLTHSSTPPPHHQSELHEDSRKHAWKVVSCYHVNTKHVLSRLACSCLGDQLESAGVK